MKKFKLQGCMLDTAILSIVRYLIKIGTEPESLDFELDYLVNKYDFVEKSNIQDFKYDITNMFFYKYNQRVSSIDPKSYAEFKLDSYGKFEAERELVQNLQQVVYFKR